MRAQLWSFDAMTSVLVFFVGFAIVLFSWGYIQTQTAQQAQSLAVEGRAHGITEGLLRTEGLPVDWNAANVQTIGIAEQENVINRTLLLRFLALPEATAQARFGIAQAAYRFRVLDANGSVRIVNGQNATAGTAPHANASLIIPVLRFALLDGDLVKIELHVWQPA